MEKQILNIREVANLLGVSTSTVRRWDSTGVLRSFRTVGGHRRYRKEEIDKFIENQNKPDGIVFK